MTRITTALIALALMAFLVACGGGTKDNAASTGSGTVGASDTPASSNTVATPPAQATTSTAAPTPTQSSSTTDSSSAGDFNPADCAELQSMVTAAGVGNAFTGGDVPDLKLGAETFKKLADNAPERDTSPICRYLLPRLAVSSTRWMT